MDKVRSKVSETFPEIEAQDMCDSRNIDIFGVCSIDLLSSELESFNKTGSYRCGVDFDGEILIQWFRNYLEKVKNKKKLKKLEYKTLLI